MKQKIIRIGIILTKNIRNIYLKKLFRRQIRRRFLKSNDVLDSVYKRDIEIYWKQFGVKIDTSWHKWYSTRNGIKDSRYIPEDIYYSYVEPFFNKMEFRKAYEDKSIYSLIMPEVKRPTTIIKNISGQYYNDLFEPLSELTAITECLKLEEFIIKPSIESGGGKGVKFIDIEKTSNKKEVIKDNLNEFSKDFVVQKLIDQNADLKRINPESVNTIRTLSFFHKGEVHILSSVLRMGVNGSRVDNQAAGGISVGITNEGYCKEYAYNKYGEPLLNHPQGFKFINTRVPGYNKVLNIIKEYHLKLGHFRIVSWDFAINLDENPVLIEYNLGFQEINFHQINNGPLFDDLTDEVLTEVFGKR